MPSALKIFILKSGWGSSQVQAAIWKRTIYIGVSQPATFYCALHCWICKWCKRRKRAHAAVPRWPHRCRSCKRTGWRSPPRLSDPVTEKCLDLQQLPDSTCNLEIRLFVESCPPPPTPDWHQATATAYEIQEQLLTDFGTLNNSICWHSNQCWALMMTERWVTKGGLPPCEGGVWQVLSKCAQPLGKQAYL